MTISSPEKMDLEAYCLQMATTAQRASSALATLPTAAKDRWLTASADALLENVDRIIQANSLDLAAAAGYGLTDAAIDRLVLNQSGIEAIAQSLREIAALRDPVGQSIEGWVRPNGLEIRKVRVPLGVVFFIYESRPNVTVDAAAICVKSGNAVILRGGKEAMHSSQVLVDIITDVGSQSGIPSGAVQLVSTTDRSAVGHFLKMNELIDVAIPRGGKGLIERVMHEARMPVIKHYDGNCHVYVDASADLEMAVKIVVNSKCQRLGVCNTCESLLVHRSVATTILPAIAVALTQAGIELRGDRATCSLIPNAVLGTELDWSTEYLGPIISICVVESLDAAIEHINRYGSHHTDVIVTENLQAARQFQLAVDSSAVMVNASTRFNDGGQFGLGAEIGISTDKFHARGPCGLGELTTYKYLVTGSGQIRQ
ncbi:MAG TPA: glutamate-5-semialdehyde dehydrogenase [Planctomycetaceae bacterium]|nr:glutamate-5-semialdehyde dehydrogenase [Planctomycetaceae bacterium]